jgi:hypothetical protein
MEIPNADVGTTGPSILTTKIPLGWSLLLVSIFVRNFGMKRGCPVMVVFRLK